MLIETPRRRLHGAAFSFSEKVKGAGTQTCLLQFAILIIPNRNDFFRYQAREIPKQLKNNNKNCWHDT
ncbi:MAG: hypothetical protein NXI27_24825 [Alphaproteobacteria bacterium]|nr:hypothetical protein [Alphaproteobacteria bacterium]